MQISRRFATLFALSIPLAFTTAVFAADDAESVVAAKLEAFRAAQIAADAGAFDKLCAAELSYSHSDARVEDKATFIANATSGKKSFTSLQYENPKIRVVGDSAIVRFHWLGEQLVVADGTKPKADLHILMTWVKQGSDWKLLTRSATKM